VFHKISPESIIFFEKFFAGHRIKKLLIEVILYGGIVFALTLDDTKKVIN